MVCMKAWRVGLSLIFRWNQPLHSTRHDQNPRMEPVIVPISTVTEAFKMPAHKNTKKMRIN